MVRITDSRVYICLQVKKIEDEMDLGQLEEVIEIAKAELELIDYYYGMVANVSSQIR